MLVEPVRRLLQRRGTDRLQAVIPVLPVPNVDAALTYYRDVLGYSIEGRHKDDTGEVVFGSVLSGAANLYISQADGPVTPSQCYILVDEVDDLCATFKAKGARILDEPADKDWGYRQFTLEDMNGHILNYFRFLDDGQ